MIDERERWSRVKNVLGLVLEAGAGERATLLEEVCGGDRVLREEVESLLRHTGSTCGLDRGIAEAIRRTVDAAAPAQIGHWRVERLLGSGGMGTVYLALRLDDQLPERVAIKITAWGGDGLIDRFRRERRILAGLIHPYIARLLDVGLLDDGRPYLVMEYVDGLPIDEYIERTNAPVLGLFLKVCAAVSFAHENLVIHRDLKAGNILVTQTGEPRLLDFGIARLVTGDETEPERTQPWERMLTPASASPEQAAGGVVGTASDVYSLGILLYRLLTGVSPYAGASEFASDPARAICEYEPPPASAVPGLSPRGRRELRGDLDNILRKALEKDPGRRYHTVQQFAADIERHHNGLPVEARPASFGYRAAKFLGRHRVPVVAAALLLLTLAGGVVASLSYANRARLEHVQEQREFVALSRLTHSFLFEIDDSVQTLPGATAVHELVLRRAVEYLDQLSAGAAAQDEAVLLDVADGYRRVAHLFGMGRQPHQSGAAPGAALDYGLKALAISRRLTAAKPGDAAVRADLAQSLWTVAGIYQALGDLDRASETFREDVRINQDAEARQPLAENRYQAGAALTALADVNRMMGRDQEALAAARQSLLIRQAILDADPSSPRAHRAVGISHSFIGYMLALGGDFRGAAEEHRAALAEHEWVLHSQPPNQPPNPDRQRLPGVAQENLCEALSGSGDAVEAIPHCQAALAIYRSQAAADSHDLQPVEDMASGLTNLSRALDRAHQPGKALEVARSARKLCEQALTQDPDSLDLVEENADSLIGLASLYQQLGTRMQAQSALRDGKAALAALTRRFPHTHMFSDLQAETTRLEISLH